MATENLEILKQLVESLEKAEDKLERAYKKKKQEDLKKAKMFILESQKKIAELSRT